MTEINQQSGVRNAPADPEMATELRALEDKHAGGGELPKRQPAADKQTPKPSMGRIVIVRQEHHVDAPGIITAVREDGTIDVHVFRGDHLTHLADRIAEVSESDTDTASGWFWPPRG